MKDEFQMEIQLILSDNYTEKVLKLDNVRCIIKKIGDINEI